VSSCKHQRLMLALNQAKADGSYRKLLRQPARTQLPTDQWYNCIGDNTLTNAILALVIVYCWSTTRLAASCLNSVQKVRLFNVNTSLLGWE